MSWRHAGGSQRCWPALEAPPSCTQGACTFLSPRNQGCPCGCPWPVRWKQGHLGHRRPEPSEPAVRPAGNRSTAAAGGCPAPGGQTTRHGTKRSFKPPRRWDRVSISPVPRLSCKSDGYYHAVTQQSEAVPSSVTTAHCHVLTCYAVSSRAEEAARQEQRPQRRSRGTPECGRNGRAFVTPGRGQAGGARTVSRLRRERLLFTNVSSAPRPRSGDRPSWPRGQSPGGRGGRAGLCAEGRTPGDADRPLQGSLGRGGQRTV